MKTKQTLLTLGIILTIIIILVLVFFKIVYINLKDPQFNNKIDINKTSNNSNFDYNMIQTINNTENSNYLISPLSISYVLSMLRDGSLYDTKKELEELLTTYKFKNLNVPNRISIANALFLNENYKDAFNKEYTDIVLNKYDGNIIFDKFKSPKAINDWAYEKTYKMIPNLLENIDKETIMAVINAIAVDLEWEEKFTCADTKSSKFTTYDNNEMDVAMMTSNESSLEYLHNSNAKGIIKKYKTYNDVSLEYIALMPENDIFEYVNNFDKNELDSLLKSKKSIKDNYKITLKLPRYTYDYEIKDLKDILIDMGVKDTFNSQKANFSPMLTEEASKTIKLYVSKMIHKTHIELNENGTKAAAVTAAIIDKGMIIENDYKYIDIEFNKPFIYLIKEKDNDNILFFGLVTNPDKYSNNCK